MSARGWDPLDGETPGSEESQRRRPERAAGEAARRIERARQRMVESAGELAETVRRLGMAAAEASRAFEHWRGLGITALPDPPPVAWNGTEADEATPNPNDGDGG